MSKKILFVVGSLKKESFNKKIAQYVESIIGDRAKVEFLDYSNVPFFNEDTEWPAPASINEVRQKTQNANGIWIFSPEYNAKIPGVLKNVLDWLSRSLDQDDSRGASAINNKKTTITAAAWTPKAPNVRKELAELLPFMRTELVLNEGTGITLTPDFFTNVENALTEEEKSALSNQVDKFLEAL